MLNVSSWAEPLLRVTLSAGSTFLLSTLIARTYTKRSNYLPFFQIDFQNAFLYRPCRYRSSPRLRRPAQGNQSGEQCYHNCPQ